VGEFQQVGHWIADVIDSMKGTDEADAGVSKRVADEVRDLTRRFPIYG
jgi:glycine hydroxymethyltransferase